MSYSQFKESISSPVEKSSEKPLDDEQLQSLELVNQLISEATPKSGWREIDGTTARPQFRKLFYSSLAASNAGNGESVDEVVQKIIDTSGYDEVYSARAVDSNGLSASEKTVWENHQPENVSAIHANLNAILQRFDVLLEGVPEFIKQEYRARLEKEARYSRVAGHIGDEEFTSEHLSAEGWQNLLDPDALVQGDLKLRFEDDSLEALNINLQAEVTVSRYKTIADAVATWNLTEQELARLALTEQELQSDIFPADKIQQFFMMLHAREPKLSQWQVVIDESKTAIVVSGDSRTLYIPKNRVFTPADLVCIPAHEEVHVVGAENGYSQPVVTLQKGMDDFGKIEEGKAIFAELITGQKFGDPRQVKMAARYYAVSMAIKTERAEDGSLKAKYSMQDIYDTLIEKNVDAKDAQDIVWRIMRGTTLQRKVVEVEVGDGQKVMVSEVYPKDAIYFEGQMLMFKEFFNTLPLSEADRERLVRLKTRDVSSGFLARVGRQAFLGMSREQALQIERESSSLRSDSQLRTEIYQTLQTLGKDVLYELLQYYLVGLINLDALNENWKKILVRDPSKLANYRKVMRGFNS